MNPHRKSQKKLKETLNQMYGHLDTKYLANEASDVSMCMCAGNEASDVSMCMCAGNEASDVSMCMCAGNEASDVSMCMCQIE